MSLSHTIIRQMITHVPCGRCKKQVYVLHAESCWYCMADLCIDCWEQVGHCGHTEAEQLNAKMRAYYASLEQEKL